MGYMSGRSDGSGGESSLTPLGTNASVLTLVSLKVLADQVCSSHRRVDSIGWKAHSGITVPPLNNLHLWAPDA
jgi:hypothetical protein